MFSLNFEHRFKVAAYIKSGSVAFPRAYMCIHVLFSAHNEAGKHRSCVVHQSSFSSKGFISAQKSPAAELLSPLLKLGLNYSQSLEKMAAQRPIKAGRQHAARQRFIVSGILLRRLSEAICSPAAQTPLGFEWQPRCGAVSPFSKLFSRACVCREAVLFLTFSGLYPLLYLLHGAYETQTFTSCITCGARAVHGYPGGYIRLNAFWQRR